MYNTDMTNMADMIPILPIGLQLMIACIADFDIENLRPIQYQDFKPSKIPYSIFLGTTFYSKLNFTAPMPLNTTLVSAFMFRSEQAVKFQTSLYVFCKKAFNCRP